MTCCVRSKDSRSERNCVADGSEEQRTIKVIVKITSDNKLRGRWDKSFKQITKLCQESRFGKCRWSIDTKNSAREVGIRQLNTKSLKRGSGRKDDLGYF